MRPCVLNFEALELNPLLILRLWSLEFLEIYDFGVKVGSCEPKNAEMLVFMPIFALIS